MRALCASQGHCRAPVRGFGGRGWLPKHPHPRYLATGPPLQVRAHYLATESRGGGGTILGPRGALELDFFHAVVRLQLPQVVSLGSVLMSSFANFPVPFPEKCPLHAGMRVICTFEKWMVSFFTSSVPSCCWPGTVQAQTPPCRKGSLRTLLSRLQVPWVIGCRT